MNFENRIIFDEVILICLGGPFFRTQCRTKQTLHLCLELVRRGSSWLVRATLTHPDTVSDNMFVSQPATSVFSALVVSTLIRHIKRRFTYLLTFIDQAAAAELAGSASSVISVQSRAPTANHPVVVRDALIHLDTGSNNWLTPLTTTRNLHHFCEANHHSPCRLGLYTQQLP